MPQMSEIDFENSRLNVVVCLNRQSPAIRHLCGSDDALRKLILHIGDITYYLNYDSLKFLVDTIIGQMLSNKVADVLSNRLLNLCDGDITIDSLEQLSIADFRGIGLSTRKAEYIQGLIEHVKNHPGYFDKLQNKVDKDVLHELIKLRGIGSWSAKMFLIFVLDRPDILPYEDGAFLQAFNWLYPSSKLTKDSIIMICERWRPYSSIASRYLYIALDSGLTKHPFVELRE